MSDLGKVAVTLHGNYDNGTTYEKLSIVTYNYSSWISTTTTRGNTPSNNSAFWQSLGGQEDFDEFVQKEFDRFYGTYNKTTQITRNDDGSVGTITETTADAVVTSVFSENEYNNTNTITTTIVPTTGPYNYSRVVLVNGDTITQTYVRTTKE